MFSLRSAAEESVAKPMSYVPPSPAQHMTGFGSLLRSAAVTRPVATAGEAAKVLPATGTP
jgi:hypothetical protein